MNYSIIDELTSSGIRIFRRSSEHVVVRCPYCGDSLNPASAHLYIKITPPYEFYCQRCTHGGVLSLDTLRDLEIYDPSLISVINDGNSDFRKNNRHRYIPKFKVRAPNFKGSDTEMRNLKYFNDRYGTDIDHTELESKYSCILDVKEFISLNNIRVVEKFKHIDFSKYIGFVSSDKSHLIARNTVDGGMRYININIHDSVDGKKEYNITDNLDIMSEKIRLIMTEGIFDIIGVREHFYKSYDDTNTVFVAGVGKAFNSVINSYSRKGCLDLDVIIYADSDTTIPFYKNLKKNNKFIKDTQITVYFNSIGKDFGVEKSKINLMRVKI